MRIPLLIGHRCLTALSTLPDGHDWLVAFALLLGFTAIALPVGFAVGFLQPVPFPQPWKTWVGVLLVSLLTPAFTEELCFRVILLPQLAEQPDLMTQALWGGISLILFLIYHPVNALLFFHKGRGLFNQPTFLFLAALLGIICTIAYWESSSIWPPVVLHWAIVVTWLLLLGGYDKLYAATLVPIALAQPEIPSVDLEQADLEQAIEPEAGTDR